MLLFSDSGAPHGNIAHWSAEWRPHKKLRPGRGTNETGLQE